MPNLNLVAGMLTFVTEVFHGLPQSLEVNARIIPRNNPFPSLSTSFLISHPLILLLFDAIQPKILITFVTEPQGNN
jgi:hypothetical protein